MQLTSFVGREREKAAVRAALEGARLVTLTGPGGSGKTRLAAEVAEACPDGVAWLELAPVDRAERVPQAAAAALGVVEQAGRGPLDALLDALRPRRLLLVLDNCEHLAAACADLAESVLRAAPGARVLATSREPLAVAGEVVWPVPPLSLPPHYGAAPEETSRSEAVRLFVERAGEHRRGFALTEENRGAVAQLCRRLDGIPLAIELAAARVRVLTPTQIAGRLDDCFRLLSTGSRSAVPRQQTLRATIDWSHDLLDERERILFRRLAVFAEGWALEDAEEVCGFGALEPADVLDLLSGLVDRSLVAMRELGGEARYRFQETVRQYAAWRLDRAGEREALRHRHGERFLRLAEEAAPHLRGAERGPWAARLRAEDDNLRAALAWAAESPRAGDAAPRMAAALWWLWLVEARWREGRSGLEAALAAPGGAAGTAARAAVLRGAGVFAWVMGDFATARARLEEGAALAREREDPRGLALALGHLAPVARDQGDPAAALALAEEAVALARAHGSRWELALILTSGLAYVHHTSGNLPAAEAVYRKAEEVWRGTGDGWGLVLSVHSQAVVAWLRGELPRAEALAGECVRLLRGSGDRYFLARALMLLGMVACQAGDFARGARLLGAEEAIRDALGAHVLPFERPPRERSVAAARTALGEEGFASAYAEGRALPAEGAAALALRDEPGAVPRPPPSPPPPAVETAVRPEIGIFALGPLRIVRGEDVLAPADWGSAKPRELLLHLLCHPEGRTKAQIGLALWPEASPAQLRNNFHVALHHLRRALGGAEWVVYEGDRYAFNRALPYRYDTEEFERHLAGAREGAPAEAIRALEAAVALYRGDFLEDTVFGDWHLEHQDALRRRYLDALLDLGGLLLDAGRPTDAADAFRRALLRDELREEAHRGLMRALTRTGDRTQALRRYAALEELLRDELGMTPGSETVMLSERIRRGEEV